MQAYAHLAPTLESPGATSGRQQQVGATSGLGAFVARLMSLSAHELQALHSDCEVMRQLGETQLMVESRLHELRELQWRSKLHQQQQLALAAAAGCELDAAAAATAAATAAAAAQLAAYQDYYARAASHFGHHQQLHLLASVSQQQPQLPAADHHNHNHHQPQPQPHRPPAAGATQHQQPALDLRTAGAQPPSTATRRLPAKSPASSAAAAAAASSSPAPKRPKFEPVQSRAPDLEQRAPEASPALVPNTTTTTTKIKTTTTTSTSITTPKTTTTGGGGKRYKGEFDEPNCGEVEARVKLLARTNTYHQRLGNKCACVLGSEFPDRPVSMVLDMIHQWRHSPTDLRTRTKWDVDDLPKDIPLSEIKKFEELRREVSEGRADFGGASKRKPLGIRGTRQFLMILYCLWGHPGRDDPMQREGYCPHCFAKIKKANEQSTLVRVVNHFNMKHRKGANPRLSPHGRDSPNAASALAARKTPLARAPARKPQPRARASAARPAAPATPPATGGCSSPAVSVASSSGDSSPSSLSISVGSDHNNSTATTDSENTENCNHELALGVVAAPTLALAAAAAAAAAAATSTANNHNISPTHQTSRRPEASSAGRLAGGGGGGGDCKVGARPASQSPAPAPAHL